nr:hypothetical protein [uncultured bacterium]
MTGSCVLIYGALPLWVKNYSPHYHKVQTSKYIFYSFV